MSRFWSALAFALLSAPSLAQQLNPPMTPSMAVTPTGPLAFSPALILNPVDFGAKCDGATDDTAALQRWAAAARPGVHMATASQCRASGPITFPSVNNVTIDALDILYAGTLTAGQNVATIGVADYLAYPNLCVSGWSINHVRIMASVVQTAGAGLMLNNVCETTLSDALIGGGIGGDANLYNGLVVHGVNHLNVHNYSFKANNIAEEIAAVPNSVAVDIYQDNGKISRSAIGLHLAGGVGGFTLNHTDILKNGANVLFSQRSIAAPNHETFFGPGVAIDSTNPTDFPSSSQIGIEFEDPGDGNSSLSMEGTWVSTASAQCIKVDSGAQWRIHWVGGLSHICNGKGLAIPGVIDNESTTSKIEINGVRFYDATSVPYIYNVAGANPILLAGIRYSSQGGQPLISGAWTGSYWDDYLQRMNYGPISSTADLPITATTNLTLTATTGAILAEAQAGGVQIKADAGPYAQWSNQNMYLHAGSSAWLVMGAGSSATECGWGVYQNGGVATLFGVQMDGNSAVNCYGKSQIGTGTNPVSKVVANQVIATNLTMSGPIARASVLASALPTCSSASNGLEVYVSDFSAAPARGASVTTTSGTGTANVGWTAHCNGPSATWVAN